MHISPSSLKDAHYLKDRLRQSDKAELEAATGRRPSDVVPLSFALSTVAYTVRENAGGNPLAMYGVSPTPHLPGVGTVWMLCTPNISTVSRPFLRHMSTVIPEFLELYPNGLHNIALYHPSNIRNLRWIKAAGFEFGNIISHKGKSFIYFSKRPSACVTPSR